jgi:hypothetical protein
MVQAGPHSGPGMTETMTTAGHGVAAFLIAHSWDDLVTRSSSAKDNNSHS